MDLLTNPICQFSLYIALCPSTLPGMREHPMPHIFLAPSITIPYLTNSLTRQFDRNSYNTILLRLNVPHFNTFSFFFFLDEPDGLTFFRRDKMHVKTQLCVVKSCLLT